MSLWIKICGNTSLADARLAVDAGADAVGFVFAPSPRRVTPQQVADITAHLPATIETIGVFVDADFAAIDATVEQCGLSGVQLHSEASAELTAALRQRFGLALRILRVLHFGAGVAEQLQAAGADANTDAILIDSRTATAVGGTGIPFDWKAASTTVFSANRSSGDSLSGTIGLKLIAAGGLSPANVAEAIATLHPWGVDVVSGVESAPGKKDPAKVRAFIDIARAKT